MAMKITDVSVGVGGRAAIMFKDGDTGEGGMITVLLPAEEDNLSALDRQARNSARKLLLEVADAL